MRLSTLACALTATLACAGCSQQLGAPVSPASAASSADAPASPVHATTTDSAALTAAVAAKPTPPPVYLFDLLQRPDFVKALGALHGAQILPPWVRKGGTATPVQSIPVDGKPMLLASACKPHDCTTERVALLYNTQTHAMWGLFAQRPEDLSPAVDPDDSSQDKLSWLGQPDPIMRQLLHDRLYPH